MDLYDVSSEGYHTPLTSGQIADLFRAGRLRRDEPCRRVGHGSWRTLDELFPLLKYHSGAYSYASAQPAPQRPGVSTAFAATLGLLLLGVIAYLLWDRTAAHPSMAASPVPVSRHYHSQAVQFAAPAVTAATPTSQRTFPISDATLSYSRHADQVRANLARLAEEQRQREEDARERTALADRMRAEADQQKREAQQADGRDVVVPLDEYTTVTDVGGSAVAIKIHDNDVTSFDAWINGGWFRNIPKNKGATHSRRDETFIYRNGRASLYYVWEISGSLNSCLLRVREE